MSHAARSLHSTRAASRRPICSSAHRRDVLVGTLGMGAASATVAARPSPSSSIPSSPIPKVAKRTLAGELQVIKGNWQLSGGHRGDAVDDRTRGSDAVADFQVFEDAGITTFDTADIYGPSEALIGAYVRRRGGSDGLQLLTKSCKFGNDMLTISQKSVSEGLSRSLHNMEVPSVDLVQFYWHDYSVPKYVEAAQYLMEEVAKGRVRHFGVTNFDVPRMQQMMDAGVVIASNQVQYSLLDRRPENKMQDFCQANDIKLLPFGTVAGGFLSEKYLGKAAATIKADTYSKSKYTSVISQCGGWEWFQRLLATLNFVAQKHNTTIANVSGRWVLDKPSVAGIIVGARNANHVEDHQRMMELVLDDDDVALIEAVVASGRQSQGDVYSWERGGSW